MKNIKALVKNFNGTLRKRSPEILLGFSIAQGIGAVGTAIEATPKAVRIIDEAKENLEDGEELTKTEVVKLTWKNYIPTALLLTGSVTCSLMSHRVTVRRGAAYAAAYNLSANALTEYKAKVKETLGQKKAEEISQAIAEDNIKQAPPVNTEVVVTGRGETIFRDVISGRYFKSDINKIEKIINELNHRMISENYIALNEFYWELGLSNTSFGAEVGWNLNEGLIDVTYTPARINEGEYEGGVCMVIDYCIAPRYRFDQLY